MGYDSRLLYGPRVEPDRLAAWLPTGFAATGETLAYDDFIAQEHADSFGIGAGTRTMLVFDPGRQLPEAFVDAWRAAGRIAMLDLCERTDDYTLVVHARDAGRREIAWRQRKRIRSEGARLPEENGHRFPARIDASALLQFVDRLGFDENPLDWRFTTYARTRRKRSSAAARRFAFGPPFVRLLAIANEPPRAILDAIECHVALEYLEPLELDHILGHALRTAQVAVAACPGYTIVFDASGSLAFDLRWLTPIAARHVVAAWGHLARDERAFESLDEPACFGFALYDTGLLRRRVTFSAGRIVETIAGLPASLVGPIGKALPDEAALVATDPRMTVATLATLLGRFDFDGSALPGARYETYRMIPR